MIRLSRGLAFLAFALSLGPALLNDAGASCQPVVTYRLVERLRIGGDEDTVLTGSIAGITVGSGILFVLQPNESQVARYNEQGRFLGYVGRRGSGPGEFQFPATAGWFADSLWIYDDGLRRVQLFDRMGIFARAMPTPRGQSVRPLADDTWLVPPAPGTWRETAYPILVARGNGPVDTVAAVRFTDEGVPLGRTRVHLPGVRGVIAFGSSGTHFVIVEEINESSKLRIRRFTASGRLVVDRSLPYAPIRSTPAWYDSSIKSLVRATREMALGETEIRRALPYPKFLNALERAVLASDGRIWIQRLVPPGTPSRFLMLDSSGRAIGEAEGAPGLRLMHVEKGELFAVARTPDGSYCVVVLVLEQAPRGTAEPRNAIHSGTYTYRTSGYSASPVSKIRSQ